MLELFARVLPSEILWAGCVRSHNFTVRKQNNESAVEARAPGGLLQKTYSSKFETAVCWLKSLEWGWYLPRPLPRIRTESLDKVFAAQNWSTARSRPRKCPCMLNMLDIWNMQTMCSYAYNCNSINMSKIMQLKICTKYAHICTYIQKYASGNMNKYAKICNGKYSSNTQLYAQICSTNMQ